MREFLLLLFILSLSMGVYAQDKLPETGFVFGTLITCVQDSTAFFESDTLKIDLIERDHNTSCKDYPKFSGCCSQWPSGVAFNYDKGVFYLNTNCKLHADSTGRITEIAFVPTIGNFTYDRAHDQLEIALPSAQFKRSYLVYFQKKEGLLFLYRRS